MDDEPEVPSPGPAAERPGGSGQRAFGMHWANAPSVGTWMGVADSGQHTTSGDRWRESAHRSGIHAIDEHRAEDRIAGPTTGQLDQSRIEPAS